MSSEINRFCIEIVDLQRLYRLISPLVLTAIQVTIVVSDDGLRFVCENGTLLQVIIYYNVKNLQKLEKNQGSQFVMIKVAINDFLDILRGCKFTDTVAKIYYNEGVNENIINVDVVEEMTKTTFKIEASPTIATTAFRGKEGDIPQNCTLLSKNLLEGISYIAEHNSEVKLVISSEELYLYSDKEGTKDEYYVLFTSDYVLDLISHYADFYWYSSDLLKKLLPFLKLTEYCKIKISREGVLELKIEFNDSDYCINCVQVWISGINNSDFTTENSFT
uniref:Cell cycle checkpoint protein RAD1 (inferred by orthology to a human protein) n=1 Tax=Strongyloides venezuelensis TaxID=75913 RepID=A0A0K0F7N7_STRVS